MLGVWPVIFPPSMLACQRCCHSIDPIEATIVLRFLRGMGKTYPEKGKGGQHREREMENGEGYLKRP